MRIVRAYSMTTKTSCYGRAPSIISIQVRSRKGSIEASEAFALHLVRDTKHLGPLHACHGWRHEQQDL